MNSAKRFVRAFVPSGCFMFCLAAYGQTPAAGENWQRLIQLPLHTQIHVKADSKGRACSLDSVDEGHLSCSTAGLAKSRHYNYQRADIKSIRLAHYVRSTLLGTAIGAGAGAILGVVAAENASEKPSPNAAAAGGGGAVLFGVIGAVIGAITDFGGGPTVYRR
jgi:hypothetical protein